MKINAVCAAALALSGVLLAGPATASDVATSSDKDARIRRVVYSPDAVVTINTKRGQVTHIVLAPDEAIVGEPATGQGSDCRVETSTWCVATTDGRDLFVKPKAGATTNNLIVVSTKRRHVFELVPVDKGPAAMRVAIVLPPPPPLPETPKPVAMPAMPRIEVPPPLSAEQLVANRMRAAPLVRNADYSVAVGQYGEAIVPTLVWDDGRFTYFQFPGNRPLPAVFETAADKSEEVINVRMNEDGLLVADRVSRRFVLRLGESVAAIVNEAFDPTGQPPKDGTLIPGVARVVQAGPGPGVMAADRKAEKQ